MALGLVAIASAYLARRSWRLLARRPAGGCSSGCGSCPSSRGIGTSKNGDPSTDLVSIGGLLKGAPTDRNRVRFR